MRKALTIALTMALMLIGAVTATAADAPMEEVVVTGEYAGPGMWQITHPDHPVVGITLLLAVAVDVVDGDLFWAPLGVDVAEKQSASLGLHR